MLILSAYTVTPLNMHLLALCSPLCLSVHLCSCPRCSLARALCKRKLLVDVCVVMQLGMLFLHSSCLRYNSLSQANKRTQQDSLLMDVSLLTIVSVHYTVSRQHCSSSLYTMTLPTRKSCSIILGN